MIIKNLSNIEKREEKEKKWRKRRIYILKILIAMFDKCDVEHMLYLFFRVFVIVYRMLALLSR